MEPIVVLFYVLFKTRAPIPAPSIDAHNIQVEPHGARRQVAGGLGGLRGSGTYGSYPKFNRTAAPHGLITGDIN
jgi:hypothetical protein